MAREFAKKIYNSPEWAKVRDYVLRRDAFLCQNCGDPAEEVHHIVHISPNNAGDIAVTLNPDNLVSLCRNCHLRIHEKELAEHVARSNKQRVHRRLTNEDGTYFDDNGLIVKRKVHIVYGSPRSGKTTYVSEHKEEHDIVIDVDALLYALQGSTQRYADSPTLGLALDVRDFLYDKLEAGDKNYDCHTVWIIGGFPEREQREQLATRLKADLIYIDSTQQVCEARALEGNLYGDKQYSLDVVNRWWRKYQK